MTIRVTVKNEDTRPNAIVGVETPEGRVGGLKPRLLIGGESAEFYVHGLSELRVFEAQVMTLPPQTPPKGPRPVMVG